MRFALLISLTVATAVAKNTASHSRRTTPPKYDDVQVLSPSAIKGILSSVSGTVHKEEPKYKPEDVHKVEFNYVSEDEHDDDDKPKDEHDDDDEPKDDHDDEPKDDHDDEPKDYEDEEPKDDHDEEPKDYDDEEPKDYDDDEHKDYDDDEHKDDPTKLSRLQLWRAKRAPWSLSRVASLSVSRRKWNS